MTRINVIPADELMDQHLVAEYREIFMIGPSMNRSRKSASWSASKIPKEFTLNTGHVLFFANKGLYLKKRYDELVLEMKGRGMNPNPKRVFKVHEWPTEMYQDWVPPKESMQIIRERIALRISQRPDWYRKTPLKT